MEPQCFIACENLKMLKEMINSRKVNMEDEAKMRIQTFENLRSVAAVRCRATKLGHPYLQFKDVSCSIFVHVLNSSTIRGRC